MATITANTAAAASAPRFTARGVINWLVAKDRAYRDAQASRKLPAHLLQDVGLIDTAHGLRR